MVSACLPLPREISEEFLQVAARSVCDRPGESPAECASRTAQLVHASLGFLPRDGLEYILATLVFGHWGMILDSMHDVHVGMSAALKVRTKSGIVAMDRAMMQMIDRLQASAVRPALTARRAEAAPVEAPVAGPPEAPGEVVAEASVEAPSDAPVKVVADAPVEAAAAPVSPAAPAGRAFAPMLALSPPVARIADPTAPGAMLELVKTMGDPELTAHVVAFEKALAAVNDTLAEAKAEQRAHAGTKAAGD